MSPEERWDKMFRRANEGKPFHYRYDPKNFAYFGLREFFIEQVAAAIAEEREACAEIAAAHRDTWGGAHYFYYGPEDGPLTAGHHAAAEEIARDIRARGEAP